VVDNGSADASVEYLRSLYGSTWLTRVTRQGARSHRLWKRPGIWHWKAATIKRVNIMKSPTTWSAA